MKYINRFIPHLCVVLCLILLTLLITDLFNGPMAFINNRYTKAMLFCLAVCVLWESVLLIVYQRKK